MMQTGTIKRLFDRTAIRRYLRDSRGLAAIEFAMLAPMMAAVYIGAVEINHVMTLDRKVTAIASATSDLVAQQKEITTDQITDIFEASSRMIVPYDPAVVAIVVTCVIADIDTGATTVLWSDTKNGTARNPGASITVPDGLVGKGESVILTEITYSYDPIFGKFVQTGFTIDDKFYVKPRRTTSVVRK